MGVKFGILGGSGLYQFPNLALVNSHDIDTPFGKPSGPIREYHLAENQAFFLPRHGEKHHLSPSEINYRANIYALKQLGVSAILSVSAVGSLREEIAPGHFVLPDQYIDLTRLRQNTFFGDGVVAHAHFADPCCATLRNAIARSLKNLGYVFHQGGTYICIEGPYYSTRAESVGYRAMVNDRSPISVIGMTAMPEAKLAREAGLCYQTLAMTTDYDGWREGTESVTTEMVLKVLQDNVHRSRALVQNFLETTRYTCHSHCSTSMQGAVITPKEHWPSSRRQILEMLLEPRT